MWDSGTKWDSKVSCYRTYHTIFVTLDKYCLVENKYYVVFDKIVKNTANRPSGWLNLIQCFDKRPQSLFGFGWEFGQVDKVKILPAEGCAGEWQFIQQLVFGFAGRKIERIPVSKVLFLAYGHWKMEIAGDERYPVFVPDRFHPDICLVPGYEFKSRFYLLSAT